ncbi:hypothetical protein OQA88_12860 [Cercophora sp. LCS_1]
MGKRVSRSGDPGLVSRKRQKVVHEAPTSEEVHTSRQLRALLTFTQDVARTRHGLQSLKIFLEAALEAENPSATDHAAILGDYLQSMKPRGGYEAAEDDEHHIYLSDVMQTWSYASQTNNDGLMSAVPVAIALLLKYLSRSLEMVPFGLGICRTLLQKQQLELISRNLSTDKGKAFIISPTLRMLREALSFDGGAIAKPLFRTRASTFKSLARNMGIVHIGDEAEDEKRPSTRSTAILFFLSAIKFLHPEAKKELISQRDIVAALTRDIKQDPPYLVRELLSKLKECVLMDDKVPREAKGNLLHVSTLVRISALYQVRQSEEDTAPSVADAAHDFLMAACTNPACGVLRQDSGLYPRDVDLDAVISTAELEELGLEAITWMNKYKSEVPVRNYTLANFLPNLRPWASVKQSDLVTAIFKVAPELVAHYFLDNKSFTFEPKLSATWIGYAAFLFKAVTLPIPEHFSRSSGFPQLPPPTTIVIDNILPLPLTQKALLRCLASKSNMISFFATRILVVAIEKLDTAIKMHQDTSHANPGPWQEAARRLIDEFCQRSPGIKDMINSFRSIPEADLLHREAASRLLRLCYEVLPQVALLAKFDVSPFLETSLGRLSKNELDDPKDFALCLKELENLLAIAGYSPGMRWFSASDALTLSPFTMLLKVCVDAPSGVTLGGIQKVLDFVAAEQQLVSEQKDHPGLLVLLETLQTLKESYARLVWPFLDNCLTRCATAPIKYLEAMHDMAEEIGLGDAEVVVSPLVMTILEQLPFAVNSGDKDVLGALGKSLPKFFGYLLAAGESKPLLEAVYTKIAAIFKGSPAKLAHKRIPDDLEFKQNTWPPSGKPSTKPTNSTSTSNKAISSEREISAEELESLLALPDTLTADNSALTKWASKTADELIDEGYAASLIKLLTSEHASIRKEALVSILKAAAKIRESEHEEKEQIWLLLSELAETARSDGHIDAGPLSSPVVAFACHALNVLRDPLHSLYPKINQFLARGPIWNLDRLPLVDEILLEEPAVGDSYYAQLNWLLGYLIDGLRTEKDLELFRKRRAKGPVLERILALGGNPYMRVPLRTQVLRLLYRITSIEGGSTTLTTRFGVMNWLEAMEGKGDEEMARLYRGVKKRVWETCDQQRVETWSRGGVKTLC